LKQQRDNGNGLQIGRIANQDKDIETRSAGAVMGSEAASFGSWELRRK
jgi:hypothetical protein